MLLYYLVKCHRVRQIVAAIQRFIDHAIGQWRRRFECVVQQQYGHIEHLMKKLQDVTVTLHNN